MFSKRFFVRIVKSRDCVVKAIDGTSHEIYRAQVEPQETYYSGHRNYHAIHVYPDH